MYKYKWQTIVRDLRQRMMLSQEEMADQLGVAFSTINRYENGHFNPTPKIQRQIRDLANKNKIKIDDYKE